MADPQRNGNGPATGVSAIALQHSDAVGSLYQEPTYRAAHMLGTAARGGWPSG